MTEYILDTDHVMALVSNNRQMVSRLNRLKGSEVRFGVSVNILGELYFIARLSKQMEANTAALTELLADLYIWDYDRGMAETFGEIEAQQASLKQPVPTLDAQIAAVARQRQAILLSSDPHFRLIRDIKLENWLDTE